MDGHLHLARVSQRRDEKENAQESAADPLGAAPARLDELWM
jgi:hypothetical protein